MDLCNGPGAAFSDGAEEPAQSPHEHPFMRAPDLVRMFLGATLELAIILLVAVSVLGSSLFMAWRDSAPQPATSESGKE